MASKTLLPAMSKLMSWSRSRLGALLKCCCGGGVCCGLDQTVGPAGTPLVATVLAPGCPLINGAILHMEPTGPWGGWTCMSRPWMGVKKIISVPRLPCRPDFPPGFDLGTLLLIAVSCPGSCPAVGGNPPLARADLWMTQHLVNTSNQVWSVPLCVCSQLKTTKNLDLSCDRPILWDFTFPNGVLDCGVFPNNDNIWAQMGCCACFPPGGGLGTAACYPLEPCTDPFRLVITE